MNCLRPLSFILAFFFLAGCEESASFRPRRMGGPEEDVFEQTKREIAAARPRPLSPGNVKITLIRYEINVRDREGYDLVLAYRRKSVAVAAGRLAGANGALIFAARDGLATALAARGARRQTNIVVIKQFLVTRVGFPAQFAVVRRSTRVWTLILPVYQGAVVVNTIREEVTGTGLRVKVLRATARRVVVELTPYFHGVRKRGGVIEVTQLTTRLSLIPGQAYVIMSDRRQARSFAASFFSSRSGRSATEVIQLIQVELGK